MTDSNAPETSISLFESLIPVIVLISLLAFNVYVFGDGALSGSNQFALLLAGGVAALMGFKEKISFDKMIKTVAGNIESTSGAILILLFVGALSGTWLISGIIPAMIYYGLDILSPSIFLPATVVICSIISLATGSSWTTSATVGIALIAIGNSLGFNLGMVAGAVLSGAYFGDKLSPMSDTTNLAPAMAGTDLFTHIRYMMYTTIPSIVITIIIFAVIGFSQSAKGEVDTSIMQAAITDAFNINGWLFIVPVVVIALIVRKTEPLIALFLGTILAGVFALIFQPGIVIKVGEGSQLDLPTAYKGLMNAITVPAMVETSNTELADLFSSKGMSGMLNTIWLIVCAMVFGGFMEAIGALHKISAALLKAAKGVFGLFASTVASCLTLNITASDQYLAIVVPGKMFKEAYKKKGLAPENLSRTLEDSGTVTSVLVPWNTCGAYQSNVLGVDVLTYLPFAFFNYISPFMTLLFAALSIKIKTLTEK
ncbi:Na+/H+ antiporter NhaC [Jiulongibacter sediminis]|jgi:NhaC family Na+:H+ antiporter|uniref:Sodium:proton antiporter n=1 Tax=Jiulongibacter sediminis TaxID=1605367 RepID=A0A0P7BYF3_9BACT|nr:Na+/H+ antiporter NhaC [Jiulongibacter sediminis]KPM49891.1 sodium:proton antiporter [Jiulongibacter sediminis]TBX26928.1 sodium:proton antiporter [Jiulongibacter sediminis]